MYGLEGRTSSVFQSYVRKDWIGTPAKNLPQKGALMIRYGGHDQTEWP